MYGYFIMIDITFDFRSDSKGRDPDTYRRKHWDGSFASASMFIESKGTDAK